MQSEFQIGNLCLESINDAFESLNFTKCFVEFGVKLCHAGPA